MIFKLLISLILFNFFPLILNAKEHKLLLFKNKKIIKIINKGEIFAESNVYNLRQNSKTEQVFKLRASGMHRKSCRFILRKLSKYENYKNYISYVKKSTYSDNSKELYFLLSSSMLPFNMELEFKLPRIKKAGIYNFSLTKGRLKDLNGTIQIFDHKNKCIFSITADWQGANTGIPNIVFEFFSKTMAKKGLEKLFRISQVY